MENKPKPFEQKLLEFQNSIDTIKKDSQNPHFKNTYASLGQILSEVKPILNALKLILMQPIEGNEVKTFVQDSESDKCITSGIALPTGLTPQQLGSAITYYRRYSLTSLLALEIDDDDDGQVASVPTSNDEKQWLNKYTDKSKTTESENWIKVCKSLKEGYTLAQVESKYKLSKELKAELIQIQNNG